jgi:hypothetical protein
MNDWPEYLPLPSATSFGGENAFATIRTEMETGRVRQRRRFTTSQETFSVTWILTADEFEAFKSFHLFTLEGGANFFDILLPVGVGLETMRVRFVGGTFRHSYQSYMNFQISATLETETPYAPADDYLTLFAWTEGDPSGFVEWLHEFIHTTLPETI